VQPVQVDVVGLQAAQRVLARVNHRLAAGTAPVRLLAFEALKRVPGLLGRLVVVVAAIGVSLAPHALVFELSNPLFEIVRRLPSAGLALMLALTGPMIAARVRRSTAATSFQGGVPLAVEEIDWVAAAGNYVELHAGQRTMLHRAPLATVEAVLKPHGFVRIHRSRLVARRAIARVRPTDVVLHCGVSLKTGARYRAELAAALG
jgi:hypothetical protein